MANEQNNAKKEKFINLLNELFQLNQPELDFGLYRIMHAKSEQIQAFIQDDLTRDIDEALASGGDDKVAELKAAYEQARAQAVEFGIPDPDSNPKVQDAKAAYDAARENGDDPSDIYDHLYRFLSRYYDKGDFMSRRYHVAENDGRAAPYAVPYDGREVYLHWANKDQYYIKSSETLRNFSFDLAGALVKEAKRQGKGLDLGIPQGETLKVQLRLVDAAESAHNNVKENQSRFFILHEVPVELTEDTLFINFEYRPDPEKSGQEGTWQKKRLEEAEAGILEALRELPEAKSYLDGLGSSAATEKQKDRTLLGKYLAQYTARNTMDYFIHKDLGGFLRRELDFYIKNEVMRLDDVDETNVEGVTRSLKKIAALRKIGRQIVAFLAQLEDFQKKLWLKKKFVTEVNYCITLDRVPEEFYPEIAANEKQREEWERLFLISELEDYCEPMTEDFLKSNPYLVLDTAAFPEALKERLLSTIEGLDQQNGGVVIHGENSQALELIRGVFAEQVKCVYIDPPYNTGNDEFIYKDVYRHSSWMSMLGDRISSARRILGKGSSMFVSVDDNESLSLKYILDNVFGSDNFESQIIVQSNKRGQTYKSIAKTHEYLFVYDSDSSTTLNELPKEVESNLSDELGAFELWELRNRNPKFGRFNRPNLFYPIYVDTATIDNNGYACVSLASQGDSCVEVFPRNSANKDSCWRWGKEKVQEALEQSKAVLVGKQKRDGGWNIYEKARKSTTKAKSIWSETGVISEQGTVEVGSLGFSEFGFPKPISLVDRVFRIGSSGGDVVLDFFCRVWDVWPRCFELES